MKNSTFHLKSFLSLFLLTMCITNTSQAQCTSLTAEGVFNPNDDVIISSYHQSIARTTNGYVTWGEDMSANGSNATTLTEILPANGYNYTGSLNHFAVSGNSDGQGFLSTDDDLYAWGAPGEVVSNDFVSGAAFGAMLNVPFSASDVVNMHASSDVLFVLLNSGEIWVATNGLTAPNGNDSNDTTVWQQVQTSSGTPLTNAVQVTGNKAAGYALMDNGDIYAWGDNIELGNGSGLENLDFATQMVAPPVAVSYISAIFSNSNDPGLLALGNDTKVYGVGDNTLGEIITSGTGVVDVWTAVQDNMGSDFVGALYLATSHSSEEWSGAAVITANPTAGGTNLLYTWGSNNTNSIGQSSMTIPDPSIPPTFTVDSDDPTAVSVGGHATTFFNRAGGGSICFVGHVSSGSTGGLTTGDGSSFECVIPATVQLCGIFPAPDDDNDGVSNTDDICNGFDDSANADGDSLPDGCDLDDDNDGIPDTVEGVFTCTTVADLNTPGFATNTNLVTGGTMGSATLNGLDNGVFNFSASVSGTATWNGGIQIQNQAPVGNFIYAQPENASNANPLNVATYEFDFPNPVSNFEFFIGGLNNGDKATITAFIGLTPINITPANFSDFSAPELLVSGNTVVGNLFDNEANPLINTFKVTVPGDVDRIVVTSGKSINDNNNVTIGMYSFAYCSSLIGIDFDKDGIPNSLDLDSDNDGILDIYEAGGTDLDGDGKVDDFIDTDDDGLNDAQDNIDNGSGAGEVTDGTPWPLPNTDNNAGVDYLDIDADDDGIVDNIEGQSTVDYNPPLNNDDDNDGIDDQYDVDFAGNNAFTAENTDGDALEDYRDLDSDNDGDDDILEAWDSDSNGIPSLVPLNIDSDGDGLDDAFDNDDIEPDPTNGQVPTDFPDAQEPGGDRDWRDFADIDNDGVADNIDLDNDNDGIPDIVEGTIDSDSDGTPDFLDLDSDNDGITDAKEAGGTDADGDGRIDNFVDTDDDGLNDAQDNIDGGQSATEITDGTPLADTNSDNDTLPNRIDRDSDDDGIPDVIEAGGIDNNGNGIIDNFTDNDGDGLDDSVDPVGPTVPGTPLPDTNSDADPVVDRLDVDSDNDGLTDTYEAGGTDANGDGRIDGFVDADNDGFTDTVDTDDSTTPTALDGTGTALPRNNFDGDGRPDYLDQDSDDDGITDTHEAGGIDANRDGEIDGFSDTNGDGLNDTTATTPLPITNTDMNGNPDFLDIDADDDGIVDNIEGQSTSGYNAPLNADDDNDGIDNQYDIDFPGNNSFTVENTDGDALEDYRDLDSDNDTIDDVIEGWDVDADGTPETVPASADADGDGLDDNFDTDDANPEPTNGQVPTDFPDAQLPGGDRDWRQSLDIDGDGVNDNVDLDNDNDGIPDAVEGTGDSDGDGIPDYLDLDSDNDGIPDIIEAGGTDADGDGQIDYPTPGDPMSMNDMNNDGLDDDVAASPLPDTDTDGDGVVDRLDLDSDNDGITDIIEAGGTDANGDGRVDYATPGDPTTMLDVDGDGFIDTIDSDNNSVPGVGDGGTPLPDTDTDGPGRPNRLDLDSDNDGIYDVIESGGTDVNGDGRADDDDDNMDNTGSNGIPTSAGGGTIPTDTGADGSPDYTNLDSDGDSCSDANEAYQNANADGGDNGIFGLGTPTVDALGRVEAASYDTGVVAAVTDATDTTACDIVDTDGDGVLDDQEITDGTDPNNPCDFDIASITEVQGGDWLVADCDGDGVTNGQEITDGTNPEDPCDFNAASISLALSGDYLISDCDGDGVTNGTEIIDGTDPEDPCDFLEESVTLNRSGDWLTADCDGDMIPNDQEDDDGTDPNDPCSNVGGTPPAGANCDTDLAVETDFVNPGVNEGIFQINNIELYPNNTVRIYNRWGILVFETEGYDNGSRAFRGISNGRTTVNTEKELPVGIYFYIIDYVDEGTSKVLDGYLYVNR